MAPPLTKSTLRWHVVGWLLYGSYDLIGLFLHQKEHLYFGLWLVFSRLLIRSAEFYLCYLVVYPRLLRAGRALPLAAGLLGVVALYIGSRALIEEVIYPVTLGFWQRLQEAARNQPVPFHLLPPKFPLNQLQRFYEALYQVPLDNRNFRKWVKGLPYIEPLEEVETNVSHRPSRLYHFKAAVYVTFRQAAQLTPY